MVKTKRGPRKGEKHATIKRSAFGMRLFATRKARGFSQIELGEKIALSKRMISYYEGDTVGPPVEILKKISEALNVTTSYLMQESPLKTSKEDEVSPTVRKHLEVLKKLPTKEQKTIFHMIELASKNGTSDK